MTASSPIVTDWDLTFFHTEDLFSISSIIFVICSMRPDAYDRKKDSILDLLPVVRFSESSFLMIISGIVSNFSYVVNVSRTLH